MVGIAILIVVVEIDSGRHVVDYRQRIFRLLPHIRSANVSRIDHDVFNSIRENIARVFAQLREIDPVAG
jgi:hypothetical protein